MDSDSTATHCNEDVLTTHAEHVENAESGNHMVQTNGHQESGLSIDSNRPNGLHRHATKYPHGLPVSVQTIDDNGGSRQPPSNYSRASTLRSSRCEDRRDVKCRMDEESVPHRKYQVGGLFSSPENLAELQVRRYKYPLTGNYYLDHQEAASKAPLMMLDYAKRFCKWKYLRWPLIFVASVLVFFGLITYSIWLHDISVARERYLQQRKQHQEDDETYEKILPATGVMETTTDAVKSTTWSSIAQESTIMRNLNSRYRYRTKNQKLTTVEYALSKGVEGWDKHRKDVGNGPRILMEETTTLESDAAALVPVNAVHFHTGQQNNLGIAEEDDERVLKLINGLFPSDEPSSTSSSVDTLAKVSPTIPPVTPNKPTAPMTPSNSKSSSSLDSRCYSTSLDMCQGVLDYDLTYNVTMPNGQNDIEDYRALIHSNCSLRSVEFICAVLEPECRPSHIGILPPCRRICKAIMEACSEIIANSDTLTATFDCNAYPDSNDPHRCEDPTRRKDYCYDNEFECYDRSCIPHQWQCDNIKDCSAGEDEENCLICDQADEFRCRSNEKCVPESARCDMKYDCFDGSDEESCSDYEGDTNNEGALRFDEADMNAFPRVFSYASILSPNQPNASLYTYIATTSDEQDTSQAQRSNHSGGVSKEEVTNSVPTDGPKGFVNFRDSKEIMLTSDSENNFKFSSAREVPAAASTTPLQPAASILVAVSTEPPKERAAPVVCPAHQLRCVSGKCITVDQLCDKKMDCPDGFDELMCVYKDRTTTVRNRGTTILPNPFQTSTVNTTRSDKRTLRTTIKRKIKP